MGADRGPAGYSAASRGAPPDREACRAAIDLIPLVAAGLASHFETERVRRHVRECPSCSARLDEATRLVAAITQDASELACPALGAAASAAARLGERVRHSLAAAARDRRRKRLALALVPVVITYLSALATLVVRVSGQPVWVQVAGLFYLASSLVVAPVLLTISRPEADNEE